MERTGECLWPTEKLSASEVTLSGSDAAVMGTERAGDGGVGANERLKHWSTDYKTALKSGLWKTA
jgi:hypothetical protein